MKNFQYSEILFRAREFRRLLSEGSGFKIKEKIHPNVIAFIFTSNKKYIAPFHFVS